MSDLVLGTEVCHLLAWEVGPIVGDDGMGKPEVAHNILPEELDNLLLCDVGGRHCFHPLSAVVRDHQQESEPSQRTEKMTYHIKPPTA